MSDWDGIPEHWGLGKYRDIPVCKQVILARARQIRDLCRWKEDPNFPYYWDEAAADHVVKFFHDNLHHTQGPLAGRRFILEGWQEWDFIRPLFGWKRKRDGRRRFQTALLLIARGNGKTTLAAGIALYLLSADGEPAANIFAVATKEEQAGEVFEECRRQILASPQLRRRIKPYVNKFLEIRLNGRMRKRGADTAQREDGHHCSGAIVDEYHAHPDDNMKMQIVQAMLKRAEPMMIITSTAGFNDLSPCHSEQEYAEAVLSGEIENDSYLAYVCTVDDRNAWRDEREWYKANPMLGVSIDLDDFRGVFERAKNIPSELNQFKVKNLNIWTTAAVNWMPMETWDACDGMVDWADFAGLPCVLGVDIGRTTDLTAFSLAFRHPKDPKLIAALMLYLMALEGQDLELREKNDKARYREWIDSGLITGVQAPSIEDDIILEKIFEFKKRFKILRVVADPWQVANIKPKLDKAHIEFEAHPQTALRFRAPIDTLEKLVANKRLIHCRHPVLHWNVRYAVLYRDSNGNMKFDKAKGKFRNDGLVALTMATGLLMSMPESMTRPYKRHGVRFA